MWDTETKTWRDHNIPVYPALGNHDLKGDRKIALPSYFARFPQLANNRFYSLRGGNRLMLVLDSSLDETTGRLPSVTLECDECEGKYVQIRGTEPRRPSFDDDTGNVSDAWATGVEIARQPCLLPYIWVDNTDATLAKVTARGGTIVDPPHPDSPASRSTIAIVHDPVGKLLGLYQEA